MASTESSVFAGMLRAASLLLRVGAGVLALLVGIGIYALLIATAEEPVRTPTDRIEVQVSTVPVVRMNVPRVWEGYGTASAMRTAEISAQVSARVMERSERIEAGVVVSAGEVLVELDKIDFASRLVADRKVAEAIEADLLGLDIEQRSLNERLELGEEELAIESRTLNRLTDAQQRGAANVTDVDRQVSIVRRLERELSLIRQQIRLIDTRRSTLAAQLETARATARIAEENLERATIRSPIAGVVQRMSAEVGELLSPGSPVARVVDLRRIEIPVRVPVSALASVLVGDRVIVTTDGPLAGRWEGVVVRIAPEADSARRTLTLFVEVVQSPPTSGELRGMLLPGQFVSARVYTRANETHAIVPRPALVGDRVMALEPNGASGYIARQIEVDVLFTFDGDFPNIHPRETQWAAIERFASTSPPDRVILSNLDELRDGSAVRPASTDRTADGLPLTPRVAPAPTPTSLGEQGGG